MAPVCLLYSDEALVRYHHYEVLLDSDRLRLSESRHGHQQFDYRGAVSIDYGVHGH